MWLSALPEADWKALLPRRGKAHVMFWKGMLGKKMALGMMVPRAGHANWTLSIPMSKHKSPGPESMAVFGDWALKEVTEIKGPRGEP